jgi:hypothetical protein
MICNDLEGLLWQALFLCAGPDKLNSVGHGKIAIHPKHNNPTSKPSHAKPRSRKGKATPKIIARSDATKNHGTSCFSREGAKNTF